MSDALRRALRTFIQAFVGNIVANGVLSAASAAGVVDWSLLTKMLISAAAAGMIALLTFTQNALEDHTALPALLKAPASEGVNPVPDPVPEVHPAAPAKKATRVRKAAKKR
jgi:hypothetical protein